MIVIPAVDIKDGRCVRLLQGRMDAETVFSDDPAAMAKQWEDQGAERIHVVDLNGAFEKCPQNLEAVKKILETVKAEIQVGGGIRSRDTAKMYFDLGVKRVIIGTAAVRHPKMVESICKEFPNRVIVGIDAREGLVSVEGWSTATRIKAADLARQFEDCGVAAINFTDIHRDGMQTGPNIEETRKLAEAIDIPVVASGGVSTLDDIKNLLPLEKAGVMGVITGRALYSGTLDLKEAIAVARDNRL
ncbi:MAG: 1-(5-phosphoribosyl)-5-[(5-phosphoribosylamino)methylideneamino]imidazole-4-carboxamide isomerase [Desulfobacteraceae bacterium IS3]|nr:MAG: 1-(5-phosphoribosyl)-5-[(5-phosphoribosylamino)methylideneamino]imidazole-4-carboxamide isomerase [Desulfobacteraceae bacterium IS3]